MIKQPLSDTLIETIAVAGRNGGELIRMSHRRIGCWTYRNCPVKSAKPGDLITSEMPEWHVTDNTVRSLIKRNLATVTHTRDNGRPAVVRVRGVAARDYLMAPRPGTLDVGDGPMRGTICAFLNADGTASVQFEREA
jgi:hypothetical protein